MAAVSSVEQSLTTTQLRRVRRFRKDRGDLLADVAGAVVGAHADANARNCGDSGSISILFSSTPGGAGGAWPDPRSLASLPGQARRGRVNYNRWSKPPRSSSGALRKESQVHDR